jgi:hypothetical protein
MVDQSSPQVKEPKVLRIACSRVFATPAAAAPRVTIAEPGEFADGIKELIPNALYQQSRDVVQLSELLHLSASTVHRFVIEMLASEQIDEPPVLTPQCRSTSDGPYRPNLAVVLAADRQELRSVVVRLAD